MVVNTDLVVTSGQSITRPLVLESGAALDNQGVIGGDVDVAVEAKAPSNIDNHAGGTIRGSKTAIRLDHGGEVHNGAGSIIEATGTGGTDCAINAKCAIYAGPSDQAPNGLPEFTLENEGTIVGNVQMAPTAVNYVKLFAGSSITGDLDIGSDHASGLQLLGDGGTVQRYSQAVTGQTTFGGILEKHGEGTWIIDGQDLAPSQVLIDGGDLQVGDGGAAGSLSTNRVFLLAGRLVFDRSNDVTFSTAFAGPGAPEKSGTLVQAGSGVLTLANFLGTPDFIAIEDGALQIHDTGSLARGLGVSTITASITNDASLLYNSNTDIFQFGPVSGSGSVVQNGSSAVLFGLASTYTGGTTINNGWVLAGNVLPGDVTINPAGTLGGSYLSGGQVLTSYGLPGVAGDISNAGRVIVVRGDSTIGGDYVQSSTGTLAVSLGSKLDVAGTAALGGGTLEVIGADDGYVASNRTDVLAAAGGVTGTFDQLLKRTGVVFTATDIHYDANSVWLDTTGLNITIAAAGGGIGYTPVSMSSAVRVQGAFEQLNDRIATDTLAGVSGDFLQSAGQFQQAPTIEAAQASLHSLSGQLYAASAAMTFRAIDAGNQALSDHLDGLRDGQAGFGMWTQQLGGSGGMARSGFDGVGFQFDGWLVGNDYRIGRSGVAGFAFGQGQGSQQLQHGVDRDHSRRAEGMLYAGLANDHWYTQGRLGFGHFSQDIDRRLLLGDDAEGVSARYDGRYQVAYGESGLRFGHGDVRVTPFLSLEYARSERDAFTEEGAGGFGLRSDAQVLDRWQASVGARATRHWSFGNGRTLDFGAHAQWRRALGSPNDGMDASFVGLQQWSPLLGIGLSRYGSLFGVGLDARLSPRATLKLAYDYENGQYDTAQGVSAGFNLAF